MHEGAELALMRVCHRGGLLRELVLRAHTCMRGPSLHSCVCVIGGGALGTHPVRMLACGDTCVCVCLCVCACVCSTGKTAPLASAPHSWCMSLLTMGRRGLMVHELAGKGQTRPHGA